MMREEIRRRALHAAAAVSLTLGMFGCTAEVQTGSTTTASNAGGAGSTGGSEGGAGGATQGGAGGAIAQGGAAPGMDAGPGDAGDCTTAPDFTVCCEANMWNVDAGCLAWGPPMPPAMEVA